ncbi:MAG: helicase-related protein, partial [Alphaproteobacteria bacterium]
VHGQMDKKSRDTVMATFADNNSDMNLLVATTVIEVGIDVPRATIIVIENAEQFGLAALHQLRGRVGRGNLQSYCVLLYGNNLSPDGMKRLDVLCDTDDGFVIAEQDLMMRGIGELIGTRQSGWINYHFADWREHRDLFKLAARAACDNEPDTWTYDLMNIFECGANINA